MKFVLNYALLLMTFVFPLITSALPPSYRSDHQQTLVLPWTIFSEKPLAAKQLDELTKSIKAIENDVEKLSYKNNIIVLPVRK